MTIAFIPFEQAETLISWQGLIQALESGHSLPKADIQDSLLYRRTDTLLSRSAWIDGLGLAVKSATIFPGNTKQNLATINGGVTIYSDDDGRLQAVIDFHLVTKWKTAGDSLLAAKKLARPDSNAILIVGAGTVGASLREAYGSLFPDAKFVVWNRTVKSAEALAQRFPNTEVSTDLSAAVKQADIVTCATMSTNPLVLGQWLQPGQHVDLIGAYRPDMREVDDAALLKSRIFVDSRDTTLDHIGELKTPLENGVFKRSSIVADFYDLPGGKFARTSDDEITLFKNGGGAHLDLMTSKYIYAAWQNR